MLSQGIASLTSKAAGPLAFAFEDVAEALRLGSDLIRLTGVPTKVEFYISFSRRVTLEEVRTMKTLASAGIRIIWDPNVTRNIAVFGGTKYSLENGGLRSLGPSKVRFSKAGFFGVTRGRVTRAQRLEGVPSLAAVLVLERENEDRLPLFVAPGILPHGLKSGDTVEAAHLSVVGERTVEGGDAPTEVFVEALAIELLQTSPTHERLFWVSAREEIDEVLSSLDWPPGGNKRTEAWQKAARAALTSSLRKETVYLSADDERYMYAKMEERVRATEKRDGPRRRRGEPT